MDRPLMPKATAVWLVDNTTLTFEQIAKFCGLHALEVKGIADGEVGAGIRGLDPVSGGQLERSEIERCEKDASAELKLLRPAAADIKQPKRKTPRYTPLSKRQDRPAAIAWLVKFHPELADSQISKLVGTTKPTIQAIRERTHWNITNIQPVDPVALGLCKQIELDTAVAKAAKKAAKAGAAMTDDERMKLVSTEQSLQMEDEARMPSNISGLENFSLTDTTDDRDEDPQIDADSLFNLPEDTASDDEEQP